MSSAAESSAAPADELCALRAELRRCEEAVAARRSTLDRRGAAREKAHDVLLEAKRAAKRAEKKADDAVAALRDAVMAQEAAAKALRKADGGAACHACGAAGDGDVCKACGKAVCAACAQPCASCGAVLCADREGAPSCVPQRCYQCDEPICDEPACLAPEPCTCDATGSGFDAGLPSCTDCSWGIVAGSCKDCGGGKHMDEL